MLRDRGNRQIDCPHRSRRSAHVRNGIPVSAGGNLQQPGAALRASGYEYAALLQRSQRRPNPGRGHNRGRIDVLVHRRRFRLRHSWNQHDSVLYLLLDVRTAARLRFDLGRGGHTVPRVPFGRHGRPHHSGWRRSAASGRQQPRARASDTHAASVRSGVCLRNRHDHRGRYRQDVRQGRKHLLLHHGDERALRDASHAAWIARRHSEGHVPVQGGERQQIQASRSAFRKRLDSSRSAEAPRKSWRRNTTSPPTSGALRATKRSTATESKRSAGISCTQPRNRACLMFLSASPKLPVFWWPQRII